MKGLVGLTLSIGLLLVSCSSPATTATPLQPPLPTGTTASTEVIPQGTPGATCAAEEVNEFAGTIASSYPFTSQPEVIAWFCEGAEFEDIMVALETEEMTGEKTEDLLQMRADGLSWDEIWQIIGLFATQPF